VADAKRAHGPDSRRGATPEGFRPTSNGNARSSTLASRWVRGRGFGGRRREPLGVAHLRGGVLTASAPQRSRRTASLLARRSSSSAHQQTSAHPPKEGRRAREWCQGWSEPTPERTWRGSRQGRTRRGSNGCASRPEEWTTRGRSVRTYSVVPQRSPTRSAITGSPTFSSSPQPGVTGAARGLDGTRFRGGFLRRRVRPRRRRAGRTQPGLAVAMPNHGLGAGLTLRSPAASGHRATLIDCTASTARISGLHDRVVARTRRGGVSLADVLRPSPAPVEASTLERSRRDQVFCRSRLACTSSRSSCCAAHAELLAATPPRG